MKKKKAVASVSTTGNVTVGASNVIRWGDVVSINGYDINVSKAVNLGIKYKLDIAEKLIVDLKSKTGLLITFPLAILMSKLQEKIGSGEKLLELVKA
jgi:hypothetical protein